MMISNCKKPFGLHGFYKKYFSVVRVNSVYTGTDDTAEGV